MGALAAERELCDASQRSPHGRQSARNECEGFAPRSATMQGIRLLLRRWNSSIVIAANLLANQLHKQRPAEGAARMFFATSNDGPHKIRENNMRNKPTK